MRAGAAAAAAAVALVLAAASASAAGGGFAIRQVDAAGYPVLNLVVRGSGPAAPRVYEDGEQARGVQVENLGRSKAIVLAVDRSKSMAGKPLERAAAAAAGFVARKPQSDQLSIVTFGSAALAEAPLSQATIDADTTLRTLSTDRVEGTALYDAVVVSAAELRAQSYPGRVLVLLTDGRDVRSLASLRDALRAVRGAHVVVDAIALGHAYIPPLLKLTRATGGTLYASPTAAALESIYRRIGTELAHTWRISYTTSARPGEKIAVSIGGAHARAVSVVLPGRQPPTGTLLPRQLVHGVRGVALLLLVVAALFFVAATQIRRLPRSARIKRLVRSHTDPNEPARRERGRRPTWAALAASLDRRLRGLRRWDRLERLVETAAVPVSAATVIAVGVAFGLVLVLIAALAGAGALAALVLFAFGAAVPFALLRVMAGRRIRAFEEQLPDVLATIAGSLRVGHGLKAALQTVAEEGAPPVSVELRRVLAEERLGRRLEEALVAMCERLASEDLLYVATAVDVQAQVGGSVAGVFTTVSDTVRQRQQHRRKVRAVTSLGRATATVLAVLPFVFVALTSLISPGYMLPFVRSSLGHALLAYCVASIAVGFLILNRMVSVRR